jgi:membrane protein
MELLIRYLEHRLWPARASGDAPAPRRLVVARYTFALLRDYLQGDISLRAMSLVYTTMLSIAPLLAFAFAVLKGLGFHRDLEPLLRNFLSPLGPSGVQITGRIVGVVDNVSGSALATISIIVLILSALSLARKVEDSFNFVWRVDEPDSFVRHFVAYSSVIFAAPLMSVAIGLLATLSSTTATGWIRSFEPLGTWIANVSSLTPYAMVIAGFTFLYVLVPNTRVRLKPALIGALFGGGLWAGSGSLFTSAIVSVGRTEAIYSGFAVVILGMLWLHLSWVVLLLGAQLAFYVQNPDYLRLGQRAARAASALRERLALSVMLLVARDHAAPGSDCGIDGLAAQLRVPRHLLAPVLTSLIEAGILERTHRRRLSLTKAPPRVEIRAIVDAVRRTRDDALDGPDDWNPTVDALANDVERAIGAALGTHSLADLVAADAQRETEQEPSRRPPG